MIYNEKVILSDSLASVADVLTSEDTYISLGRVYSQDCYSSMSTVYIIRESISKTK